MDFNFIISSSGRSRFWCGYSRIFFIPQIKDHNKEINVQDYGANMGSKSYVAHYFYRYTCLLASRLSIQLYPFISISRSC